MTASCPLQVRDDELDELDRHIHDDCEQPVLGGSENVHGKVNILIQTFISRGRLDSFSLVSDMNYIVQVGQQIRSDQIRAAAWALASAPHRHRVWQRGDCGYSAGFRWLPTWSGVESSPLPTYTT